MRCLSEQTLAAYPGSLDGNPEGREDPDFPTCLQKKVVQKCPDTKGRRTMEFGVGAPGAKPGEASLCPRVGGQEPRKG